MPFRDYKHKYRRNQYQSVKKQSIKKSNRKQINFIPYIIFMLIAFSASLAYSWMMNQDKPIKQIENKIDKRFKAVSAEKKTYPWKCIILHHSGDAYGNLDRISRFHRIKYNREATAYHFIIGNGINSEDGELEQTENWYKQQPGGSVDSPVDEYNQYGIAICLVGNFEEDKPSKHQMETLKNLVFNLMDEYHIPANMVFIHREIIGSLCAGKKFPANRFFASIGRTRPFSPVEGMNIKPLEYWLKLNRLTMNQSNLGSENSSEGIDSHE